MTYGMVGSRGSRMLIGIVAALGALACIALLPSPAGAATKWLCRPGLPDNPCAPSLKTTEISPTGQIEGIKKVKPAKNPKIDCFYVYPTVSDQMGPNATRAVDPEERSIALYQAARYSRLCRVFAPDVPAGHGRRLGERGRRGVSSPTGTSLGRGRTASRKSITGRPFVLIGHSQGTFRPQASWSAQQIDPEAGVRKELDLGDPLGGNVKGSEEGQGSGRRLQARGGLPLRQSAPAASSPSRASMAVPSDAISASRAIPKRDILCANPAALGGGSAKLDSIFPSEPRGNPGPAAHALAVVFFILLKPFESSKAWRELSGSSHSTRRCQRRASSKRPTFSLRSAMRWQICGCGSRPSVLMARASL